MNMRRCRDIFSLRKNYETFEQGFFNYWELQFANSVS